MRVQIITRDSLTQEKTKEEIATQMESSLKSHFTLVSESGFGSPAKTHWSKPQCRFSFEILPDHMTPSLMCSNKQLLLAEVECRKETLPFLWFWFLIPALGHKFHFEGYQFTAFTLVYSQGLWRAKDSCASILQWNWAHTLKTYLLKYILNNSEFSAANFTVSNWARNKTVVDI